MLDLLENYSGGEIVVFSILLIVAIKEGIDIFEYFYVKIRQIFDKEYKKKTLLDSILESIDEIKNYQINKFEEIDEQLIEFKHRQIKQEERLDLLTDSDRDSIKSYFVEKYHELIDQGWVDDFTLDVLEKRFSHYEAEGGNSYVFTLMEEMRKLPKGYPHNK